MARRGESATRFPSHRWKTCGRGAAIALAGCALFLCALFLLPSPSAQAIVLPGGFRDSVVFSELEEPTAVRFAPDGRVFVAEKMGEILVYSDFEDETPEVFADLRREVYDNGDRGLLGLALDPDFSTKPYVYALYTYDHILGAEGAEGKVPRWGQPPDFVGDPCPKPESADVDACPVSGRLTRLTASGNHAVEEGGAPKEKALVEGWCQQFSSHSVGALQFDSSGALYASGGDGASFTDPDYGQFGWPNKNQCGDPPAGLGGDEEPPSAEGGALRAQDARTPFDPVSPNPDPTDLNGSLIRIDPETGEGLPGNPMFDSLDPNERRIVAYGFRNPFRFAIDPVSDEIYVDNVGWSTYEEIDRFSLDPDAAYNSGWPCYEGPEPNPAYESVGLDLCEGLYGEPGAVSLPFFAYNHASGVIPEDACSSENGAAISGIVSYHGDSFPAEYDGALFFADPVRGCIYVIPPGEDGNPDPTATTTFGADAGIYPGIDLEVGPDGALYYVKLFGSGNGTIHRISYDPGAPTADLTATPPWGAAPLQVHFDASGSTDPDGEALSYEWDFDGDGEFELVGGPTQTKTFTNGSQNRTVSVRVEDGTGATGVAQVTVYPGDTPPQPQIEEPDEALTWGVGQRIDFSGSASDAEDGDLADTGLYWKTRLYHCPSACHAHPLQVFPTVSAGSFVAPNHDYPSHIEISLTATDSRGLSATEAISIDPRAVDLEIKSDPPGLMLNAGLLSHTAPFTLTAIEGANLVLSAPASAELDGTEYTWKEWSDGGERVHTVHAGAASSYTAVYAGPEEESSDEERPREEAGPAPSSPPTSDATPATALDGHPAKRTHKSIASFAFSSNVSGALFRCRLDHQQFQGCQSPQVYRHLQLGPHSFEVAAVDALGNPYSPPQRFQWRILRRKRARIR